MQACRTATAADTWQPAAVSPASISWSMSGQTRFLQGRSSLLCLVGPWQSQAVPAPGPAAVEALAQYQLQCCAAEAGLLPEGGSGSSTLAAALAMPHLALARLARDAGCQRLGLAQLRVGAVGHGEQQVLCSRSRRARRLDWHALRCLHSGLAHVPAQDSRPLSSSAGWMRPRLRAGAAGPPARCWPRAQCPAAGSSEMARQVIGG